MLTNAASYYIPPPLTEQVFYNCGSLTGLSFAADSELETIGTQAFMNTDINSLVFPARLKTIGSDAFSGSCASLAEVTFEVLLALPVDGGHSY